MSNKPQVLVVDDATFTRDLIKKTLRTDFKNCEIHDASDGKKAVAILKKMKTMDLILCDWEMPEMSGDEVLVWCRSQAEFEKTPFVMVTSRGDKEDIAEAVHLGVTDYLTKPFKSDQLVQKITGALKRSNKLSAAKGKQSRDTVSSFNISDSTSILTGMQSNNSPKVSPTTPPPNKPAKKQPTINPKEMHRTSIQMADVKLDCLVESINQKSITLLSKRNEEIHLPLFGAAFILLSMPNNPSESSKINGYISRLEAAENKIESKFVRIVISIINNSQEISDFIARYIKAC